MLQETINTFSEGIVQDLNPLTTPSNALTYCLNGTVLTYNGNEMVLLNDMGNGTIPIDDTNVVTVPGKIVGVATLNGVAYLAIYKEDNDGTDLCEIGTFPSYNGEGLKYKYEYSILPTLKDKTLFFNFDLNHPVEMELQLSYDNSVNVILTDNKNRPRLINSGFEVLEGGICNKTKFEYSFTDKDTFDIQTSLNKRTVTISKVTDLQTYSGGNLGVGNYTFYFKYEDLDDNESDFFCESATISIYKGEDTNINGGIALLDSGKGVSLVIENCDPAYKEVVVYYAKKTSDYNQDAVTYLYKLNKSFSISDDNKCYILISGNEATTLLPNSELLLLYYDIETAKTLALALNKLFLANISDSTDLYYKELTAYSKLITAAFNYEGDSNKVGYHYGELYRFGIVYILNDGTLSQTYNIGEHEGVFRALPTKTGDINLTDVINVEFTLPTELPEEVLLPNAVIGYFFVRQKRIPTLITLIYLTNLNRYARLPMLKYKEANGGELYCLESFLKDININYNDLVDELRKKSDSNLDSANFELLYDGEYNPGSLLTEATSADSETDASTYYFGEELSDDNAEYIEKMIEAAPIIYLTAYPVVKIALSTGMCLRTVGDRVPSSNKTFEVLLALGKELHRYTVEHSLSYEQFILNCKTTWNSQTPSQVVTEANYIIFTGVKYDDNENLVDISFVGLSTLDLSSEDSTTDYSPYNDLELKQSPIWINGSTDVPIGIYPRFYNSNGSYIQEGTYEIYLAKLENLRARSIEITKYNTNFSYAAYCPEYFLNLPYYNLLFSGLKFILKRVTDESDGLLHNSNENKRLYKLNNSLTNIIDSETLEASIVAVPDGVSGNYIGDYIFRGKAGNAETSYYTLNPLSALKYGYNCNLVRGNFSAYLGVLFDEDPRESDYVSPLGLWNVYIPGYDEDKFTFGENGSSDGEYIKIRKQDKSPYYPISDRIPIASKSITCYNGDCFISEYSLRINRNFNDPSAPYNDIIVNHFTFSNYAVNFLSDYIIPISEERTINDINLGDVNAVQLGSWITFTSHASINVKLRSIDESLVGEYLESGHYRAFYPYESMNITGNTKMPESTVFNKGFSSILGVRYEEPPVEEDKVQNTYYKNRIVYSDTYTNKSYVNGYRVFRGDNYEDYTTMYGSITKLLEYSGNLLCVFEHAIAILPIKERVLAGEGAGGNVFINNTRILPEVPMMISDTYGSKWADSVIKTPKAVYGIDTDLKKIWMVSNLGIRLISDFKVEYFLQKHLSPIVTLHIGLAANTGNIKTHYNANKGDVMFTFYLNEGPRWNLCLNEYTDKWTTFYSWIPEQSFNIGNTLISTELSSKLESINLWKHNSANSDIKAIVSPTKWYGKQCPFEFEFVITDKPLVLKIFNNLLIISNKAAPDSFHYEVTGECYSFGDDLENIYILLEATKKTLGLSYDKEYFDRGIPSKNLYYKFPQYYERQDKDTELFNWYVYKDAEYYDFSHNSGTEVKRREELDLFHIVLHCLAKDITKVGRVYGNMHYKENKWNVQINPLVTMEANGNPREFSEYLTKEAQSNLSIPLITEQLHWGRRREAKVRDKFLIIRVRYTGEDLAIIHAIKTLYEISYA